MHPVDKLRPVPGTLSGLGGDSVPGTTCRRFSGRREGEHGQPLCAVPRRPVSCCTRRRISGAETMVTHVVGEVVGRGVPDRGTT